MKLFPIYLLILFVFSSCSYHIGSISGGSAVITNEQLSNIRFAYGTANTTHVLGIGGNRKEALVLEAKRNLYLNSNLKQGQAIGQTTIDFKRTIFFPVWTTRVTLSAEIIDFSSSDSGEFEKEINDFIQSHGHGKFKNGEEVVFTYRKERIPAQVLDLSEDTYIIKYIDKHNNLKVKRVGEAEIQSSKPLVVKNHTYSTPKNPLNELVRFTYKGKEYIGELMEVSGSNYLIRVEQENGDKVGLYINEKDIIK